MGIAHKIKGKVDTLFDRLGYESYSINKLRAKYFSTIRRHKIMSEIGKIDFSNHKVVAVGINNDSVTTISKLNIPKESFWGYCTISEASEKSEITSREIDELLYEADFEKLIFLEFEEFHVLKSIGILHDMGVSDENIFIMGEDYSRGSKPLGTYDVNLGLTWKSKYQGFEIFEPKDPEKDYYTIVTLGGSTTDPYLCNLKSWSEYLWDSLNKMGINTRVAVGGVASYTVTQEWIKLYRDVIPMKPDMVISYSGTNDLRSFYYEENHNFSLKYYVENIKKACEKGLIKNSLGRNEKVNCVTSGPEGVEDRAEHWVRCERMMHAVCEMEGITFYGFLQPYGKELWLKEKGLDAIPADDLYEKARNIIAGLSEEWLIDFTGIFGGKEDVFFDRAHVYEKGNMIIATKILPFVVKSIKK